MDAFVGARCFAAELPLQTLWQLGDAYQDQGRTRAQLR
jgi:hypothetical protein